jgi:hypothetical protein
MFENLMAMTLKIVVSWDVMPFCLLDKYQHFGGTWYLLEVEAADYFEMFVQHGSTSQNTAILHIILLQ